MNRSEINEDLIQEFCKKSEIMTLSYRLKIINLDTYYFSKIKLKRDFDSRSRFYRYGAWQ